MRTEERDHHVMSFQERLQLQALQRAGAGDAGRYPCVPLLPEELGPGNRGLAGILLFAGTPRLPSSYHNRLLKHSAPETSRRVESRKILDVQGGEGNLSLWI
jgi:hypothetical protein